jgi:hypothetical protein
VTPKDGQNASTSAAKDRDTFLITSINVEKKKPIKKVEFNPQEQVKEYEPEPEVDLEGEFMSLMKPKPDDDLEHIRKMIRKTKKEVSSFANNLYGLKCEVKELNDNMNVDGNGVSNNIFDGIDTKFMAEGAFVQAKNGTIARAQISTKFFDTMKPSKSSGSIGPIKPTPPATNPQLRTNLKPLTKPPSAGSLKPKFKK